jgi:transcriptional regulator with XRE-family HTH domain
MTDAPDDPRLDRLAEVLELLLDLSGLSRRELARRLGSDYPVRRILKRDKEIRVRQLLRFADAIEIKPGELFRLAFDDGSARPSPLLLRLEERSRRLATLLDRPDADPAAPPGAEPQPPGKENGPS